MGFFYRRGEFVWNWIDFIIVGSGWVDFVFQPDNFHVMTALLGLTDVSPPTFFTKVTQLLRILRLLRIMRLVKLIKKIPALWSLWQGVGEAMASMLWVLVLTLVVLYAFSVLVAHLIRDGSVYPDGAPPEVLEVFPNVWDSVFVLFTVMNGD